MNLRSLASEQLQDLSAGEMAAVEGGVATVVLDIANGIIDGLTDFVRTLAAAVKMAHLLRQMK